MVLQSKDSIDELTRGDIVVVKLRPYFSDRGVTKQLAYWLTETDDKFDGRFTYDHFVGQNLEQGSIFYNQILEYSVRRTHASVEDGMLECNQFSVSRINPMSNGYSERRSMLEENGLWVPEASRPVVSKPEEKSGLILYPKDLSNNIPPLSELLACPVYSNK